MTRLITYGFHDRRGGREARLNRALEQAEQRYPWGKEWSADLTDPDDGKSVIRVEVRVPDDAPVEAVQS
jgi:hypothetical protein